MEFRDLFLIALQNWVEEQWNAPKNMKKVTGWSEHTGWGGGCSTCGYGSDNDRIEVTYLVATTGEDDDEETATWSYEGTFGEILNDILGANP